jgi:tetratricopeptide (TPR) repeat protein
MRAHYFEARLSHILFEVADRAPVLTAEGRSLVDSLPLRPEELRDIRKLPSGVSVLDILRGADDALRTMRLLAFLRLTEALEFVSPTGTTRAQAASPTPQSDAEPGAAPRISTHLDGSPLSLRSAMAVKIARAVGRSIPPPASEKRARLEAAQAFEKGRREAEGGKWDRALEAFRRAVRCMPDALEYGLHAAWAEVMAAGDAETRKQKLQEAAVLARRAIKQEPDLAYAHYVEGIVALESGRDEIALRRFRHAAKLNPGFVDAVRHARILQRRLER